MYQKFSGFDSWSGNIGRLPVQSPVWVRAGGNGLVFLSHIDRSLSLSQMDKNVSSSEDRKEGREGGKEGRRKKGRERKKEREERRESK